MSRHKKTRQQKVIADLRRKLNAQPDSLSAETSIAGEPKDASLAPTISLPQAPKYQFQQPKGYSVPTTPYKNTLRPTNTFLIQDLRKTGQLTLAIISAEIALYFLLTNHIITLPFIRY